MIVTLFSELV